MTESDIYLAFFSVFLTSLGLVFHYKIWPWVTRGSDTWWLGSGPVSDRHPVPGSAMTTFAVGGALLVAAPAAIIGSAFGDLPAPRMPWIVLPQAAIGLVMLVHGWRAMQPGPPASTA